MITSLSPNLTNNLSVSHFFCNLLKKKLPGTTVRYRGSRTTELNVEKKKSRRPRSQVTLNYANHYCHNCNVVTFSMPLSQLSELSKLSKLSQLSYLSLSSKPSSSSTGRSAGQKWSERGGKSGAEKENLVHRAAGIHAEKHSLIILPPGDELQLGLFSFESLFVDCSNQNQTIHSAFYANQPTCTT